MENELYLGNAMLTLLEGLEKCVNLEKIYCDKNKLTSLEGLENCVSLQEIDCSFNKLTSLVSRWAEKLCQLTKNILF